MIKLCHLLRASLSKGSFTLRIFVTKLINVKLQISLIIGRKDQTKVVGKSYLEQKGWVEINLSNICQHPNGHPHKPLA